MLLYDSKFIKHPGKLQMHRLGLYIIHSITQRSLVTTIIWHSIADAHQWESIESI